ncbi:hypothetical protein R1flu_027523 [Riccia fluitans]|uniref:F-box domain-containing protein n=1 Tax=Riccia fluitans TaxID=41844 RepID=A0ABD1XJK0_9MARC
MDDSEEEPEHYISAAEDGNDHEDLEDWRSGSNNSSNSEGELFHDEATSSSNNGTETDADLYHHPQSILRIDHMNTDRIYEILWRTEMFQERGPSLKLHMQLQEVNSNSTTDSLRILQQRQRKSSAAGEMYEMDTDLWGHLNDDLFKQVLLRLPFETQCRFRAVSRSLRSILPGNSSPYPICVYENSCPLINNLLDINQSVGFVRRILGAFGLRSRRQLLERNPRPDQAEEYSQINRVAKGFVRRLSSDEYRKYSLRKRNQLDLSFAPKWIFTNRFRSSRDGLLYAFSVEKPSKNTEFEGPSSSEPSRSHHHRGLLYILNPFTRTWRTLSLSRFNLILDQRRVWRVWQDCCEVVVDLNSPSDFVVYLVISTEDETSEGSVSEVDLEEKWFICRYSSSNSSGSNEWSIIPGDFELPFRQESLCFLHREQLLYSWWKGQLSTYDLKTGKLVSVISPGVPSGNGVEEVEMVQIMEYKGSIFGALSCVLRSYVDEGELSSAIGICRLGKDMRWEGVKIMPKWAMDPRKMLDFKNVKDSAVDQEWIFLDFMVKVLGDYMCFKILSGFIHGGSRNRVVSQSVVGFHVPSDSWQSFDLIVPHLLGATDLELFEPRCLHVRL